MAFSELTAIEHKGRPGSLASSTLTHLHPPFFSPQRRFLALLALGDVPVIHPHTLPHHRTLILHVCYRLLGTAGGRSVIVVDVIPETPALQCVAWENETRIKLDRWYSASLVTMNSISLPS